MATLITPIQKAMMSGEKRFVERLRDKLDDSCLCWFDVRLKPTRHPDYVLFDPQNGVWTLEVKDWKIESLHSLTLQHVTLRTPEGPRQDHNPLEQARTNALTVVDLLKKDPLLTNRDTGKLLFPWTYGCVLTNISRRIFETKGLDRVIDPSRVICQDEMAATVSPESFYARLIAMQPFRPLRPITTAQVDRVRAHIFPEVRIGTQASLFRSPLHSSPADSLRVMDLRQERLARALGGGHRVIHGVAGSGKTMILIYRALQLAEIPGKPILLLSFNWPIAQHLQKTVSNRGGGERAQAFHFHGWCRHLLQEAGLENEIPTERNGHDVLVAHTLKALDEGRLEQGRYGAILIDEGHDFREHPDWFRLIRAMLDPAPHSSLIVAYDDAQSIYDRKKTKDFSFKSVGINAQGRTTILRKNYRNTEEILHLARAFTGHLLDGQEGDDDKAPTLCPESGGRHGPVPEIKRFSSFDEEGVFLADLFEKAHRAGTPWQDMALAYRTRSIGERAMTALEKRGVPFWHKGGLANGYDPQAPCVKIMTMHATKGLEFPLVALMGLGAMPEAKRDETEETRLLYVAMTRATERLVITYSHLSPFVERLLQAAK